MPFLPSGTGHSQCPTLGRATPFSQGSPLPGVRPGIRVPSIFLSEGKGIQASLSSLDKAVNQIQAPPAQTGRDEGKGAKRGQPSFTESEGRLVVEVGPASVTDPAPPSPGTTEVPPGPEARSHGRWGTGVA